jgi:hypothetical protein
LVEVGNQLNLVILEEHVFNDVHLTAIFDDGSDIDSALDQFHVSVELSDPILILLEAAVTEVLKPEQLPVCVELLFFVFLGGVNYLTSRGGLL